MLFIHLAFLLCTKIYFSEKKKKSSRPRAALDLARVEKGEVIPDNAAPKNYFLLFVENCYWDPQYEFGDQTEGEKLASRRVSSFVS